MIRLYVLATILLLSAGCTTRVKMPDPARLTNLDPFGSWTEVLKEYVDDEGAVDFHRLALDPRKLEAYVNDIANRGPKTKPADFATPEARLAHYINAYNALSMFTVLASDIPETNAGFKKVRFFYFKKLQIDGERMSLADYENKIIRKLGDPRVHFALNCMAVSCPRLPRVPFTAERINEQLESETKKFFAEPRNLTIDAEKKTVLTSEILDFFPEDFLVKAPTVHAYISNYSDRPVPSDFKLKYFDYDWTINSQRRKKN